MMKIETLIICGGHYVVNINGKSTFAIEKKGSWELSRINAKGQYIFCNQFKTKKEAVQKIVKVIKYYKNLNYKF